MTSTQEFQKIVWNYYKNNNRNLPWRETHDPYKILLSEIMLQQTQVARVIEKYELFLQYYPTVDDLAEASLQDVLKLWIGLGYNRRAKFLLEAAKEISQHHNSQVPNTKAELLTLPGIGDYTASAVLAFAYNQPEIVIETNVRTAIFYHFMAKKSKNQNPKNQKISDSEVREYVEQTLDHSDPRNWYYALMDYGSHLKKTVGNLNKLSKSYTKQSKFEGSRRQVRAGIVKMLVEEPRSLQSIQELFTNSNHDVKGIVDELLKDKMITLNEGLYIINN